ncbi:hypothetical protein F2Q69_00002808 [Brassica cretica]|uniref:Uncharacterized protein n=1 Tax=Brassica cretica TaxID=69181 RepID=A0A8S9NZM9_BRACR|nr:hypothetical protein F2Q69_00002808 [Brassica cretica]
MATTRNPLKDSKHRNRSILNFQVLCCIIPSKNTNNNVLLDFTPGKDDDDEIEKNLESLMLSFHRDASGLQKRDENKGVHSSLINGKLVVPNELLSDGSEEDVAWGDIHGSSSPPAAKKE